MLVMMFVVIFIIVIVVVVVMLIVILSVIIVIVIMLQLMNPSGRRSHFFKVELLGMQNLVEVYVSIVTLDDVGLRLDSTDNLLHLSQLLLRHLRSLVQQDDVTELYLLNHQILNILFVYVLTHQIVAILELVAHAECIDHGDDTVQLQITVLHIIGSKRRDIDDGLCNRCRFANATGLDNDVVEAVHAGNVTQLLHQVHLQRATDAAILQSHQRVVLLTHYSTLLYQVGVDVHLADIIDDNCKLNTLLILQDAIQERGLTTAQITRQQQDGNILDWFHSNYTFLYFSVQS